MFEMPWDTGKKPDHEVNGHKLWLDKTSTEYAKSKELFGVQVFLVLNNDGHKTRLIVKDGQPVYENQNLEAIGIQLDVMKLFEDKK